MIVGMDFGTTNSGMSVFDGNKLHLIPLDPANANPYVARTALYITNDRAVHIGRGAIDSYYEQNINRPFKLERVRVGEIELTFAEIGTFIRDVYIEKDVLSPGRLFLSFKMGLSSPEYLGTIVGSEYYFLEDIIATYLYLTRKRAEAHLQTELDTIVLGRPVRYTDDEKQNELARERMLQAAFRAGYKTVYLQYEPIACAHHYETSIDKEQNVLIFDFGGGTLDISIMRLGSAKNRKVLANGGIAIAGDIFDQKIVRNKFPRHFGEGTTYKHGHQELPVPSAYYEAFINWQELLMLQLPDRLNAIKNIAMHANNPRKLQALINLISSSYAIKMFDIAEIAKRELSSNPLTFLKMETEGFSVRDSMTRPEFERLIRPETRDIAQRLDEVIKDAGLSPDQIDMVIRTGGSSQIPAFIDMLNERFGAEKVRDLDVFSSVTSGLGIVAHQIETGEISLPAHTKSSHPGGEYLDTAHQGGIPVVDLSLMKKFIDLSETHSTDADETYTLVMRDGFQRMNATLITGEQRHQSEIALDRVLPPVALLPAHERILLMTNDYRFLVRGARQLADLKALKVNFEEAEGFYSDDFGKETICAMQPWSALEGSTLTALIATRGHVRLFMGKSFLDKLDQPNPYQITKSMGYPAAMVQVREAGDLLLLSDTGRAVRISVSELSTQEKRIMNIAPESGLIGAFYIERPQEVIVATASGYARRLSTDCIPQKISSGTKLIARTEPTAAVLVEPNKPLWAITTKRLVHVDPQTLPLTNEDTSSQRLLKLNKNEQLVGLAYIHR